MATIIGLIDHFGPGGAQRQFSYLLAGLADAGHNVIGATYYEREFFEERLGQSHVTRRHLQKKSRWSVRPALELAKIARAYNSPRVVAFLSSPSVYAEIIRPFSNIERLVVSERSVIKKDGGWSRQFRNQLHRASDYVVTNSERQRDSLLAGAGFLADRVRCIYNGYPHEVFTDAEGPGYESRDGLVVLGKVNRNKNPIALAHALSIRRKQGLPPVKVKWAGDINEYGQVLVREKVDQVLLEGGVAKDWTWLGLQTDTSALLDGAVALYCGSFEEGLSNAVCEALCRGVPVIGSDISDHKKILGTGAGVVFHPRDPESLARAIDAVVALDQMQWQRVSAHARKRADELFGLNRMVEQYQDLLLG